MERTSHTTVKRCTYPSENGETWPATFAATLMRSVVVRYSRVIVTSNGLGRMFPENFRHLTTAAIVQQLLVPPGLADFEPCKTAATYHSP